MRLIINQRKPNIDDQSMIFSECTVESIIWREINFFWSSLALFDPEWYTFRGQSTYAVWWEIYRVGESTIEYPMIVWQTLVERYTKVSTS